MELEDRAYMNEHLNNFRKHNEMKLLLMVMEKTKGLTIVKYQEVMEHLIW